jgi:hypothetical protein
MPDKYYDVIVIGRAIGALAAAALLARRDFTVLVIGQARRSADYHFGDRVLRRRAFTMLSASSPVWWRIVAELAKTQTWKHRIKTDSPLFQVLLNGRRFEVAPDAALFAREVEREFPDARRLVSELYTNFARVTAAADSGFERDAVWPPGTFMERRETGRVASTLPYARAEPHADLLAEFPREHPYRRVVTESVRFACDLAGRPPTFAIARLHSSWTRGPGVLDGGERELEEMLIDRIEANGGVHMMRERVASIEVKRGAVAGVLLDGDAGPIGAGFVISDMTGEEIAALAGGQGISKKAQREWPRIIPGSGRFVVSLIVKRAGIPEPLGREAFLLTERDARGGPSHTIHLQRNPGSRDDEVLLVAEVLRRDRELPPTPDMRAWVVDRLCREFPFLERHLVVVDSVHDGLPVWCYDSEYEMADASRALSAGSLPSATARPRELERTVLRGTKDNEGTEGTPTRSEAMDRQLEVDPPGYLGLGGEPLRGPIGRTLLVGPSVLPGLGQEGRLLAACGAARLVTQSDKRKARMRREMWTKLEIS